MTPEGPGRPELSDLVENLDALDRDLRAIESAATAALEGRGQGGDELDALATTPDGLDYGALTDHYRLLRENEGWGEVDLDHLLGDAARAQLEQWRQADRLSWTAGDMAAVAVAGGLGVLATVFDTGADRVVQEGLAWIKKSDLLRRWESEAARLPIDYTGPHFGGPAHRVRSSGHDVARFFSALRQVQTGVFRGVRWEDQVKEIVEVSTTRSGLPFASASDPVGAVALLLKHWAADIVTPMSLPLPGWTLLYEMPDRDLRILAHQIYQGDALGEGLNLRSGVLTPQLGMLATEIVIRGHVHLDAYRTTGSATLSDQARAKRSEMLLAAHGVAGAAALTKTAAEAVAGNVTAVRHLNLPVLLRTGQLALQVCRDRHGAGRQGSEPTWNDLWNSEILCWELGEAIELADLLEDRQPWEGKPT